MTILCVGIACLDIIQVCNSYPSEDSKTRSVDQWWQRGGNASNSCTVLSLLGAKCEFLGTFGTQHNARFVVDDFKTYGISTEHCIIHDNCDMPVSTVIINNRNGSRTVINSNKNLPELALEDFMSLDFSPYSWIHFEGRNVEMVAKMIEHAVVWNSRNMAHGHRTLHISVELEKPRSNPDIFVILPMADIVFVSKDFAGCYGWDSVYETFEAVLKHTKPGRQWRTTTGSLCLVHLGAPGSPPNVSGDPTGPRAVNFHHHHHHQLSAVLIVPWGEHGAAARGPDGVVVESPAFPPPRVVDTLAAGDTFIAATIFALSSGKSLHDSITLGCRIAGAKVGSYGLSHIKHAYSEMCKKS